MAVAAPIIMGVATLVGAGMQFAGGISSANEKREVGKQQAKLIQEQAATEEGQFRVKGEALKSRQQALVGASGAEAGAGSPLLVMEETASQLEEDALYIREQGKKAASLARKTGEAGYWNDMLGTFGSLLTSGANIYNSFSGFYGQNKPGYGAGKTAAGSINLGG